MKKTFISIAGLMILTLFIIVAVDAQSNDQKTTKAKTEIKKDGSDVAALTCCQGMEGKKMAGCCSGGCSGMNCDATKCQGGKCDQASCKGGNCDQANCGAGKCGQTAQRSNCGRTSAGMMAGAMNCAKDLPVAAK